MIAPTQYVVSGSIAMAAAQNFDEQAAPSDGMRCDENGLRDDDGFALQWAAVGLLANPAAAPGAAPPYDLDGDEARARPIGDLSWEPRGGAPPLYP